jgi:glycosyltransferase involved in cell wall biosynthesis
MSKDKLKILVCPSNEGGCAYYRIILPMQKLEEHFGEEVEFRWDSNPLAWDKDAKTTTPPDYDYENIKWADIVFTQNIHNFGGQYTAEILRKANEFGKFTHFDTDDLLTDLYPEHRLYQVYKEQKLDEITKYIYNNVDLVSVTQRKFAERIRPFVKRALVVIKNAIDFNLDGWNAPKLKAARKNLCRLGWVGGIHHDVDVKQFAALPHLVNQKVGRERVHWGFYGRPQRERDENGVPKKEDWQQDVWDYYEQQLMRGFKGQRNYTIYPALPPNDYGRFYTNIDVSLAFLDPNPFNDSKSEIKVIEAGRYGVPLVATNIGCYDEVIENGVTGYLIDKNNPKTEWSRILTRCVKDKKHREEMGRNLKKIVDEYYDINKIVGGRLHLYKQLLGMKAEAEQERKENIQEVG